MKKSILVNAAISFVTVAIIVACNSPSEEIAQAEENVTEAHLDLDKANEEYFAEIETCRKETNEKIAANDQSIAEFKVRIETKKKEAKADYKKRIEDLEQKNSDMKKRLDEYKADGKAGWEKFKAEFNHDMEELGKAFTDLTVKNTK
jgi:F0F1-type ATP synthase membrane subunit b/b'